MKKIKIIGMGLIGGSLALAIKKAHPNYLVYASDLDERNLVLAREMAAIDGVDLDDAEADVIIVATPVKTAELILASLRTDALVTDVCSTKVSLAKAASHLPNYVGSHPMAGSEKAGMLAARVDLFENARFVLTRDSEELRDLYSATNANFSVMDAETHDDITSQVSHLPQIIATTLVNSERDYDAIQPLSRELIAGGFRDMTRIASSDVDMWVDILKTNRDNVVEKISRFQARLEQIKVAVIDGNEAKVRDLFVASKVFRDTIAKSTGAIQGFYDLYLGIPDEAGSLAKVVAILAKHEISLINIQILETRTDVNGVLQVSFRNERERERARDVLSEYNVIEEN
ncbi:MAG: prephenate dehydrogenase [Lactobacillales bacterium]|jgi:prephenate dehydrogenase|nr:prephenate dehydrogenase [Lactobacillales bacterium]